MPRRFAVVFSAVLPVSALSACAPSAPAGSPPPSAAASGSSSGACDLNVSGPVSALVVDARPLPAVSGGAIPDGIYDLTEWVIPNGSCAGDPEVGPTSIRVAYRFTTTEQSSNHQSGRAEVALGSVARPTQCLTGTFGAFGSNFVAANFKGVEETHPYAVITDGFILFEPTGGSCDPKALVFRRRR